MDTNYKRIFFKMILNGFKITSLNLIPNEKFEPCLLKFHARLHNLNFFNMKVCLYSYVSILFFRCTACPIRFRTIFSGLTIKYIVNFLCFQNQSFWSNHGPLNTKLSKDRPWLNETRGRFSNSLKKSSTNFEFVE